MVDVTVERQRQMFPVLTAAQLGRIAGVGTRRQARAGETLFERGDQNTDFFAIVEGAVEIVRPVGEGSVCVQLIHRALREL
jgi:CRP-like cAMP-binding protein